MNSIAAGDSHDCYYIDNSQVGATDSSNTFGYPGHARLTIPNIVYSAGAYVEIHGDGATGTYKYSAVFDPRGVGTDTSPIWIVGISRPILSAKLDLGSSSAVQRSYMILDGIQWSNGGKLDFRPRFTGNSIDHICVRNCWMTGTQVNGQGSGVSVGHASSFNQAFLPGRQRP